VVFVTPETYLKRRRAQAERDAECCPLAAEDVFPCGCGCERDNDCGCGCGRDSDCGCGCGRDSDCGCDRGCGCGQTEPPYQEDQDREENRCCCKASMVEALRLLCGECLGSLVNFDQFFFLTDHLAVGSPLAVPGTDTDNITTPTASLERFSPCNCDLLDVSGTAYTTELGSTAVVMDDVDQLSLCALKAVAFQIEPSECDDECEGTNYRRAVRAIRRAIRAEGGDTGACGRCAAHCDCDDCCCASGMIQELSTRNLSRQVTLTTGTLVLRDVTVFGSIGSALVLGDEGLSRFYLVCANAIEAIG